MPCLFVRLCFMQLVSYYAVAECAYQGEEQRDKCCEEKYSCTLQTLGLRELGMELQAVTHNLSQLERVGKLKA